MVSSSGIKVVFGGGMLGQPGFSDSASVEKVFETLHKHGVTNIDTAKIYGQSEEMLGQSGAAKQFTIDTKTPGGFGGPGAGAKDNVLLTAKESKQKLAADQVDIYYIHAPDTKTPIEETLAGINEVHKSGFFKRFGLSNFQASDVEKIYSHCQSHNYVLPSVYQGNYSAVARKQETVLFPTLRKLGIAFYAYSPLAGGLLTKTKQQILDGAGRFDPNSEFGQIYAGMYSKPSYLEALAEWHSIADEEGCSRAELAYRWVTFNSPLARDKGDAIIFGASSQGQLEQTLDGLEKGPLSDKAAKGIDAIWEKIEHDAPLDNYHR